MEGKFLAVECTPTQTGWASGIVGPTADTGLLIVDKLYSLGSDS